MSKEELVRMMEKSSEAHRLRDVERRNKLKLNLQYLNEKSIELGKPVPNEVLAVVYSDQAVGSYFFERYKEWF